MKRKRSPVFGMCARSILLDERVDATTRLPGRLCATVRRRTCCIRPRAASFRLRAAAGRVRSRGDVRPRPIGRGGNREAAATARARTASADRRSTPRCRATARRFRTGREAATRPSSRNARDTEATGHSRFHETRPSGARCRSPAQSRGPSIRGKTMVMENGRGWTPKSASCRSGSSAASSSSVGCSDRLAYGQNRSSGRNFGCSTVPNCIAEWQDGRMAGLEELKDCAGRRTHAAALAVVRASGRSSGRLGPSADLRRGPARPRRAAFCHARRTAVRAERRVRHRQPDFQRDVVSPRDAGARAGGRRAASTSASVRIRTSPTSPASVPPTPSSSTSGATTCCCTCCSRRSSRRREIGPSSSACSPAGRRRIASRRGATPASRRSSPTSTRPKPAA